MSINWLNLIEVTEHNGRDNADNTEYNNRDNAEAANHRYSLE